MCKNEIVLYPSKILREKAREVKDFKSSEFLELVEALKAKMDSYSHCVGLAANQIGSDLDVFVADSSKSTKGNCEYGEVVVVNAVVLEKTNFEVQREGCMSVPDLTGNVSRAKEIVVAGFDENGSPREFNLRDFEARVFQHEIDHLNGKVFLDRVRSARDVFSRKSYR